MPTTKDTVTRILQRMEGGDARAVDELFQLVYDELHQLARRQRARWDGDLTLNATALLHEAYLKLVNQEQLGVRSRAHFFALASRAMRHILTDYAKGRRRQKRGGDRVKISLDDLEPVGAAGEEGGGSPEPGTGATGPAISAERAELLVVLDAALARLGRLNERQSRVVECRFYGGMTIPETAEALGISPATVRRDWAVAQAWLYRELNG